MRINDLIATAGHRFAREEGGFGMAAVLIGLMIAVTAATLALSATRSDLGLSAHNLEQKRAYEAAQAGVSDYLFHLNNDTNYWTRCTTVPTPNAVNQQTSTAKRRPVPGDTGATYAIQLIPATGKSTCSTSDPLGSMIETSGSNSGTFRIRSIGYAGGAKRSIVATLRRQSFLDYVYFTQLETSDPITYASSSWLTNAYTQCSKTIAQGRYSSSISGSSGVYCNVISFINGELISGPLHTNDALVVCGTPVFGRSAADLIEVSSPPTGWYAGNSTTFPSSVRPGCSSSSPNFQGTFVTSAPVLTPPPTNSQLATVAQSAFRFTGQVRICLSGSTMTVGSGSSCTGVYSGAIPSNGVIYVSNGTGCSSGYSPYSATYPTTSGCGNVYVRGTYSGQLTIAAANDIIIDNDLTRTGTGILGLIANNFVRVYNPVCTSGQSGCPTTTSAQTSQSDCNDNAINYASSQVQNLRIDAAMLSIQHSFIVDHYNCASSLGTLTVNGAIAQKFRGPVGTFSGSSIVTGYTKNYNYDDRLRSISPPYFLDPVQSAWRIQRETLEF